MDEIEYTMPEESESDPWSSLPSELAHPSFFTISPEHKSILNAFANTATSVSEMKLDTLLSSELLSKSPISIPSFYARVWTSPSYPARARTIALDHFTEHLKDKATNSDFQGFIPHLIVALCDSSKEVRDAAATALTTLHETFPTTIKVTVIGLADLYPEESAGLKWLSTAEVKWLLGNVILPKLTECQLDRKYVTRLLGGVLNGAGKKGKKEQ
jgi:HEAT repeat